MLKVVWRKKPVEVEAYQFDNRLTNRIPHWLQRARDEGKVRVNLHPLAMEIDTLEGVMTASEGDWIIQGVQGEIYPCKADIFAATYERVSRCALCGMEAEEGDVPCEPDIGRCPLDQAA